MGPAPTISMSANTQQNSVLEVLPEPPSSTWTQDLAQSKRHSVTPPSDRNADFLSPVIIPSTFAQWQEMISCLGKMFLKNLFAEVSLRCDKLLERVDSSMNLSPVHRAALFFFRGLSEEAQARMMHTLQAGRLSRLQAAKADLEDALSMLQHENAITLAEGEPERAAGKRSASAWEQPATPDLQDRARFRLARIGDISSTTKNPVSQTARSTEPVHKSSHTRHNTNSSASDSSSSVHLYIGGGLARHPSPQRAAAPRPTPLTLVNSPKPLHRSPSSISTASESTLANLRPASSRLSDEHTLTPFHSPIAHHGMPAVGITTTTTTSQEISDTPIDRRVLEHELAAFVVRLRWHVEAAEECLRETASAQRMRRRSGPRLAMARDRMLDRPGETDRRVDARVRIDGIKRTWLLERDSGIRMGRERFDPTRTRELCERALAEL